jgi:antitoxin (DNA-binding transcriptional repressor) of toxin-antitoxin stability system
MKQVRISDLKRQLSMHLRAAEAGEVIEVMDRARAIVRVVPADGEDTLELIPASRSFASVRNLRLSRATRAFSSLEALQEERGTR